MSSSFETTVRNLGLSAPTNQPKVGAAGAQTLDQSDFLKLMTAQMKNQDPFKPVDNTQMVAQMAQFSSLAGISEMSGTLKAMAGKLGAATAGDAVNYIGRTVLTEGAVAYGRTTGGVAGAIELDAVADEVSVSISDADGRTLKKLALGKQAKGTVEFDWDGRTDTGEDAGAGPFTMSISAVDAKGVVTARTLVWAPVGSVSMNGGSPMLDVADLPSIPVTAVRKIG